MKTHKQHMVTEMFDDITIEPVPDGVDPEEFLRRQMDDCPLCQEARARGEIPQVVTVPQRRTRFPRPPRWRTRKRGRAGGG
jgi:hypothetical protein